MQFTRRAKYIVDFKKQQKLSGLNLDIYKSKSRITHLYVNSRFATVIFGSLYNHLFRRQSSEFIPKNDLKAGHTQSSDQSIGSHQWVIEIVAKGHVHQGQQIPQILKRRNSKETSRVLC